jgi:uncharacterized protein YxjI
VYSAARSPSWLGAFSPTGSTPRGRIDTLRLMQLAGRTEVVLQQRRELAELAGFETRNKFEIVAADGTPLGFAAEQGKGFGAMIGRQLLGHWRSFEIHVFDAQRQPVAVAVHPFRFWFKRIEVKTPDGRLVGALQQRFAMLHKRFDVQDALGATRLRVKSPLWKPWTFPFERDGRDVAFVRKKWSGLMKETFTDADNFLVEFVDPSLTEDDRLLVLAAGLFIDLQYFEQKSGDGGIEIG